MKRFLAIFGLGVFAGAVSFAIWNRTQKKEKSYDDKCESSSVPVDKTASENTAGFDSIKSSTIATMSERHEEAAKIIKDAVTIICQNSEEAENNSNEFQQISSELDSLLSEE